MYLLLSCKARQLAAEDVDTSACLLANVCACAQPFEHRCLGRAGFSFSCMWCPPYFCRWSGVEEVGCLG